MRTRLLCTAALPIALLVGAARPASATATIINTGGAVTILASAPPSVTVHALVDTTNISTFFESETTLAADQAVDHDTAGLVDNVAQLAPATVAQGTCVDSYLLQWDPGGIPPPNSAQVDGFVAFDEPIVGVEVLDASLDVSDGLGAATTTYPTGQSVERGLELIGGIHTNRSGNPDTFTLSATLKRLTLHMDTGAFYDQVRVLVGCGQSPILPETRFVALLPLAALVAAATIWWQRRRRTAVH